MSNFAGRIFNKKQALEREVKDAYLKVTMGALTAASATLATTEPIVLTSVALGAARNTNTLTLQVEAAAANPTDTVIVDVTGTAAAIVITVIPNDGTNNTATPVDLTTEELVELINTGDVVAKNITLTDASSLLDDQTATGGDTTPLADGGEGDGEVATFADGGADDPSIVSGVGVASIVRNDVGDYTITLSDAYNSLKAFKGIVLASSAVDLRFQMHSEAVASSKTIRFYALAGATPTDPTASQSCLFKFEFKNAGGF